MSISIYYIVKIDKILIEEHWIPKGLIKNVMKTYKLEELKKRSDNYIIVDENNFQYPFIISKKIGEELLKEPTVFDEERKLANNLVVLSFNQFDRIIRKH